MEETGLRVKIEGLVALYRPIVLNKDGTEHCRFTHFLYIALTESLEASPRSEWQNEEVKCKRIVYRDLRKYKKVWPLPDEVRCKISEEKMDLGNLGELTYQMD